MSYNLGALKFGVASAYGGYYAYKGAQYLARHKHFVVPPAASIYFNRRKRMPPTPKLKRGRASSFNSSRSRSKSHHTHAGHGTSSTGDMNKVVFKPKHVSKGALKRKTAFKKKVESAMESDMPLIRVVGPKVQSITGPGSS